MRQLPRPALRLLAIPVVTAALLVTGPPAAKPVTGAAGQGASPAIVARSQGEPCRDVSVRGFDVRGGCRLQVRGGRIDFTVLSMFGDERFARCPVELDLRVSTTGRIALRNVEVIAVGTMSGCGELLACKSAADRDKPTRRTLPWTGRVVVRDGRPGFRVDTCFDTCFGRFEGPSEFELERAGRRSWRMGGSRVAIGLSGFELSGSLLLGPARR